LRRLSRARRIHDFVEVGRSMGQRPRVLRHLIALMVTRPPLK
jgi:hypothetical protein